MVERLIEEVEHKLKKFFLNNVEFVVNEKTLRKGKLINATIKDFFIEFKLEVQKGGIKNFELPYPFEIKETQSRLVFNYKLSKLVYEDIVLLTRIKRMKPKKNSKFYDVVLYINKK